MDIRETAKGKVIETKKYSVYVESGKPHKFRLRAKNTDMFDIPFVSGLTRGEAECELLSGIEYGNWVTGEKCVKIKLAANSNLWEAREFFWTFREDAIEFYHTAGGGGEMERCFFFSNGISGSHGNGGSLGLEYNTMIYAKKLFSPKPNEGNVHYYDIGTPQSLGIRREVPPPPSFAPEQHDEGLFSPPLLCLCFSSYDEWAGIGLGDIPGRYRYNALEYTGARFAGASFYVNYAGYTSVEGEFRSPVAVISFAEGEYAALEKYVEWLDGSGFSTQFRFPPAKWHRMPIFCGWAEQTHLAHFRDVAGSSLATQAEYKNYLEQLGRHKLPVGTIVIDDKWQKGYGTFDVDNGKWPDMKKFMEERHSEGRHVLLWVPVYHKEGLPEEFCVLDRDGNAVCADVTNPEYEKFLRGRIKALVSEVGADGFKEDWLRGLPPQKGYRMHKPMIGIEFLRKFQFILHDEAHKWKPDALVETQTPFPLFRESSDMLRLNDIYFATRDVTGVMRRRAKLARIAGWELMDCDNGSQSYLDMWFEYMLAQPSIGVPALYCVSGTEATFEKIPPYMLEYISRIWRKYIDERV